MIGFNLLSKIPGIGSTAHTAATAIGGIKDATDAGRAAYWGDEFSIAKFGSTALFGIDDGSMSGSIGDIANQVWTGVAKNALKKNMIGRFAFAGMDLADAANCFMKGQKTEAWMEVLEAFCGLTGVKVMSKNLSKSSKFKAYKQTRILKGENSTAIEAFNSPEYKAALKPSFGDQVKQAAANTIHFGRSFKDSFKQLGTLTHNFA